jgi:septum formation topological specificity factor MinE
VTSLLWSLLGGNAKSARLARQRLHALLGHEPVPCQPDFLRLLQQDLAKVASRHAKVDSRDVEIRVRARSNGTQVVEIRIPLPQSPRLPR